PILIKTYGEFWNPELVNWDNSWRLLGKRRADFRGPDVDVYEERGVYVLYKDYQAVYVGKADKQSIGYRLQLHRQSWRKGPRWDMFSWFGICGLRANDKLRSRSGAFHPKTAELIATLEALLIVAIDPRLNSRREKFKNAVRLFQSNTDATPEVKDQLGSIADKLDQLLSLQKKE
ncbi:MAG: hypothetical protein WAL84_14675, partial [Candidatus Dormiibacterota bacterium]